MHRLEVAQQKCCSEARDNQNQVAELEALAEVKALEVATACKCGDAKSANCDCLTAEASWGFTGFDEAILDVVGSNSNTPELGASNGASVVATGCGCCPTNESSLAFGDKRQRVLGVELLDVLPTKLDSTNRVHNGDTLISNQKAGANEAQPGRRDEEAAPSPARQVLPIANQDAQRNQSDNCCQNDAAPGSKNLHVSHVSIIAGDVK